jgi:flagellum-specific peptidoglycan hydrolase FlgJ
MDREGVEVGMTKVSFLAKLEQAWQAAVASGVNVNKAVLFAQAAHESNWGNSGLAIKANNLFGIKASSYWKGEVIILTGYEEINGVNKYSPMKWRKYPDYAACIKNYSDIINLNSWYQDALPFVNGPSDEFLKNIIAEGPSKHWPKGEPGWATDSRYAEKVGSAGKMIERYGGPTWR